RADATCWNLARLSAQTPWTNADPTIAAPAAKTTTAPVNARVAVCASQLGRRAATQATAAAMPSRARTYEYGASATAEWMNVPPGTCTALTNAENAKSSPAYRKNGPKSSERRRAQPPMTMKGTSTTPPTRTA